jgi:hypothetical protein
MKGSLQGRSGRNQKNGGLELRGHALRRAALGVGLALAMTAAADAQTSVTTQHNDNARTGANTNETVLTPANVNTNSFGQLFSQTVDGYVYAQPLYMPGVTLGAGTPQAGTIHNIVFIATEHDTVYAFDADSNGGANASPLWQASLVDSIHGAGAGERSVPNSDVSTADIVPEVGITGTPVIDKSTNTLYVVAKSTVADTAFIQRLHALDITTGLEKFGGPVTLSGSVAGDGNGSSNGTLSFDPKWENNRPGLLLQNGIVYVGFGAHGDNGPWHGWILAYNATTLAQTSAYCPSPNGTGSGIWMSGAGLAADVVDVANEPYGRMFIATGNGTYDALTPYTNNMDYGDDHIRLDLTNGVITVEDSFTPQNQSSLNGADADVASGGVLLLPDQSSGGHTRLLIQVGKEGKIYLVDRDSMGGYSTSTDNVVQEISGQTGGLWSMPAYWNNHVYFWGSQNSLKAFSLTAGTLSSTPTSTSSISSGFPGATTSVSSNGTTNGIVWAVQTDSYGSSSNAVLRAFDATNVATELYDSAQNSTRDAAGQAVKFVVPTVINGKVYVGALGKVDVYGLLGATQQVATPTITPGGESFTGTISVTLADSTPGATIYYTTDGSNPTTLSTVYSGPIAVNTTETISAVASATGLLTSAVAQQTYTLQTQVVQPTFAPAAGSYTSAQTVTIMSATPNSSIYYTTDGSTPSPGAGTTQLYTTSLVASTTTTVKAIATASGLSNSPIASATYVINPGGTGINFSSGFSTSATSMTFNGSTGLDDTRLQLTSGLQGQAGSAFYNTSVNIQSFTTDFAMQLSNPAGDGMTFTIQGTGPTALGPNGGGLGYGPDMPVNPSPSSNTPIGKSVAVKFDLYSNAGEGPNSTGLYTNGASPTTPAVDLTASGIDLHSGDTVQVHLAYDSTTLAMTIFDPVSNKTFTNNWTVNIPAIVGGNTAYVGFTGSTGGATSSQKIETWTFAGNGPVQATATPTFSLAAGTYLGTQTVSLSDATSGATIYYTIDGSTPSTASTIYTGPLTVSATQTINAIATAPGFLTSAVATATYTIESQVSAPIFSPAGGTYATAQTVAISSPTGGATIYYTTNGSTPATSSTIYTTPLAISANVTIRAIATRSGYFNSNVSSAAYVINSTSVTAVNLGTGFSTGNMILNGSATLNGTRLRLTDGGGSEASSAWFNVPVNVQQFTTRFSFQTTGGTSPTGDGFAFVIQGGASNAVGPVGGGLGYGPDNIANPSASTNAPIAKSIAVKFDMYSNAGEGVNSTGLYTNGASPTAPSVDLTNSGVNLHTTDVFNVVMSYDGANLTMTITDATTNAAFTTSWPVNIPSTVGGNSAYVGFTGGTGGVTAIQEIIGWTMASNLGAAATPTFSPAAGTYTTAQTVSISDSTSGATIYYTTNGTTPTISSSKYTGPINVGTSQTLSAIAMASGYANSAVGVAAYTITSTITVNYGTGFTSSGIAFNGSAALNGSSLRLTPAKGGLAGSAWYRTPVNVQTFTSDFTMRILNPTTSPIGNGITFTLQNAGTTAIGPWGGGLGYGPDNPVNPSPTSNTPIAKSVAIKFDLINNAGEGTNSTGVYTNGASPTIPAVTIGNGVNLRSGDVLSVHLRYDGTTLTITITDTANTAHTFTTSQVINIPATVGGNTALVGFTAGTGGSVANQDIITWTYGN